MTKYRRETKHHQIMSKFRSKTSPFLKGFANSSRQRLRDRDCNTSKRRPLSSNFLEFPPFSLEPVPGRRPLVDLQATPPSRGYWGQGRDLSRTPRPAIPVPLGSESSRPRSGRVLLRSPATGQCRNSYRTPRPTILWARSYVRPHAAARDPGTVGIRVLPAALRKCPAARFCSLSSITIYPARARGTRALRRPSDLVPTEPLRRPAPHLVRPTGPAVPGASLA